MRYLKQVFRFFLGVDDWTQARGWLRGGIHHAWVTMGVMGLASLGFWAFGPGGGVLVAGLLTALIYVVTVYGVQMMREGTPDAASDFLTPLALLVLIAALGLVEAVAVLLIYTGFRWLYAALV